MPPMSEREASDETAGEDVEMEYQNCLMDGRREEKHVEEGDSEGKDAFPEEIIQEILGPEEDTQ